MGHDGSFNQFDGKGEFLSLLAANQRKVFSYILAAVGRRNIAEEIMQQTLLIMWRDFDKFETGTNFSAWGKIIAYHKILEYRKRNARSVLFDSEVMQRVLDMSEKTSTDSDERVKALEGCMKKLKESSQRILSMRYRQGMSCKEISAEIGRPIQTVYKNMSRIYIALKDCIDRTIAVWSSGL
jgi:RNA polymerase sigma-70 factor (ECF subfamily)